MAEQNQSMGVVRPVTVPYPTSKSMWEGTGIAEFEKGYFGINEVSHG
jgi:hypothetical protein